MLKFFILFLILFLNCDMHLPSKHIITSIQKYSGNNKCSYYEKKSTMIFVFVDDCNKFNIDDEIIIEAKKL